MINPIKSAESKCLSTTYQGITINLLLKIFKFRKEKVTKVVTVIPKFNGEHVLAAATYKYSLEQVESSPKYNGISTNKPKLAEVITKREYILLSGWHKVSIIIS